MSVEYAACLAPMILCHRLKSFLEGNFGKQPKDGSMYLSVLAIAAWVALCLNVKSSTKGIRILKDKSKHAQCVHIQTKTYTCKCTHINVPSTNCSALISAHITYHEQIQFQDEGIVIYLVNFFLKKISRIDFYHIHRSS